MDTFIGFLALAGWVLVIVAIAAFVTWGVIRLFPARDQAPAAEGKDS